MYSFVIFILAGFVAASQSAEDECMKLLRPHIFHCCKKIPMKREKPAMDVAKECFKGPPQPHSCDTHICMSKKLGYGNDDGTFNKEPLEASLDKEFESDPTLLAAIKKNCVNGDLSKFGPTEDCDLHKLQHCIHHQTMATCPEWDDEGHCSGMKDLAQKCF